LLKYLKKYAESNNDTTLQTGVEYLVTGFNLEINEENNAKYGEHDLQAIFLNSIGENTTTPIQKKWSSELESKFEVYKNLLSSKGYFKDVQLGSKEYEERLNKARDKFFDKYSQDEKKKTESVKNETETVKTEPPKVFNTNVSDENRLKAESLKNKGNDSFKAQDYKNAITFYSEAIEIYSNAIYYCNRGTSYGKIGEHKNALDDFLACLQLDPNYVRGYDRLGCTYMKLNQLQEAINCFQSGLKIDPNNQDLKSHLVEAQEQSEGDLGGMGNQGGVPGQGNLPPGGMPSMEQMQEIFNNPQMMENMGPLQDMFQNNPQIMDVAMNLMNDPNFQQSMMNMFNNPQLTNMFGQMQTQFNNNKK